MEPTKMSLGCMLHCRQRLMSLRHVLQVDNFWLNNLQGLQL